MTHFLLVRFLAIALATAIASAPARASEPRVDGIFDEWAPGNLIATDPAGDATAAFDVRNLFATNRGTVLFLRFDIGSMLNIQSGAGADGTLRIEIAMPDNRSLTIDTRARSLWRDNSPALPVSWATVGYTSGPSYASDEFEIRVDLAFFGVAVGDPITINFSSSDSLAAGAAYAMSEPAPAPLRRSAERPAGTLLRIASLNTEQTGLLSGSRQPRLLRLIDAVSADIYCLQEEYNSTAVLVDALVTATDPTEDGANWSVHKNNDCAIVSRWPLLALPSPNSATAGAVVDRGPDQAVVVFSIHPKCCGYTGNSDDAQRITQMNGLISTLNSLRAATLGPALAPFSDAPAIIFGDWNLVGSRTPLDMAEAAPSPGLTDAMPPNLIGEDVLSWRGSSTGAGSFTPGRLDLLAYDGALLILRGSFILASEVLNAAELSALGLIADDSAATDHNMLVGDFSFVPPFCFGDANGDSLVDFSDVVSALANWGGPSGLGDSDANGVVNFSDITTTLANWGAACPS